MATRTADGLRPARANAASVKARAGKPRGRTDPITSDRIYGDDEWEFINACTEYKKAYGLTFLRDSDYFRVLRDLGYHKAPGVHRPHGPIDVTV